MQEGERGSVLRVHVSVAMASNTLSTADRGDYGPVAGTSDAMCGDSLACGVKRRTNADLPSSSVVSVY